MMDTPICDFARRYAEGGSLRLHVPGHKGVGVLGVEPLDLTEIDGADSLYEAGGIIRESEANASRLFGCQTLYSTEGSSQCIRAMAYLALLHGRQTGRRPLIAAGRNAHKTFLSAAALLELEVLWLTPKAPDSYLSCKLDADDLDMALSAAAEKPVAVYLTSPDYLGTITDLAAMAAVCHRHGALLLVDCAHGAYLKFLQPSRHPIDLGADLCCASAHKTFPVLTGGAYLHISPKAPQLCAGQAKNAMALFGSTSPSYLILQSLDAANAHLSRDYPARLADFTARLGAVKERLAARGYRFRGDEPLKLTLETKAYGYDGRAFARLLLEQGAVCEYADPDFVVLMLTPENGPGDMERLEAILAGIPQRTPVTACAPAFSVPQPVLSIREAMLSPCREIPAAESVGHVLAAASVGCPPAVPIAVCGERIDSAAAACFAYYGIETCTVVDR